MPQSYSKVLSKTSYPNYSENGYSPLEKLIKHLMHEKAEKIYPDKQKLASLQLRLIKTAKLIKDRSKNTDKTNELLPKLLSMQQKIKKIINELNQKDDEFNKYSKQLIAQIKTTTKSDLETLTTNVEKILNKKIPADIKGLLFDKNGEPINSVAIEALLKERAQPEKTDDTRLS